MNKTSQDRSAPDLTPDLTNEWIVTNVIAIGALLAGLCGAWALSLCGVLIAAALSLVLLAYAADPNAPRDRAAARPHAPSSRRLTR